MDYKPQNGRGVARRRVLALMALTLPAACGSQPHPRMDGTGAAPGPAPTVAPTPSFTLRAGTASAAPPAGAKKKRKKQRGGPVPVRDGRAMLGSYLGLAGMSLTESLTLRRRQLGREQRIVHRYYSWADVPDREPEVSRDSVLMVSWRGTKLARINNGSSDRNIASVAGKLAGMKRPIMLRWGWEMNGEWFGWDGSHNGHDPTAYVRAWRRLHRIFREHGADNVAWVWSPNWNSRPAVAWNRLHRYYPGDDYVDWVGVSGYNFDGGSPSTMFSAICKEYGTRKPIVLSETAAVDHGGRSKAEWIKSLSAWVKATPVVGAVVWNDTDVQPRSSHNFRPDTDANALAAYRAMVNSSRFSG